MPSTSLVNGSGLAWPIIGPTNCCSDHGPLNWSAGSTAYEVVVGRFGWSQLEAHQAPTSTKVTDKFLKWVLTFIFILIWALISNFYQYGYLALILFHWYNNWDFLISFWCHGYGNIWYDTLYASEWHYMWASI